MKNAKLWALNRVASLLPKPSFALADLLEAASKSEGLIDFGDGTFEQGLEVLGRSLIEDAKLSPMGHQAIHRLIVRTLVTRLRFVEDQRVRPEVYAQPLTPPILILGMPRSGTTFLHRMLSVMPGVRPARTWELNQPLPPRSGKDERHDQASKQARMIRTLIPELDSKHRLDADEPDECVFLTNPSFRSLGWWMFAPVYGYLDWYIEQDLSRTYAEYHGYLRALQAAESGRFVLKAPAHTGYLAEIIAEIPGIVIVQAHRDPSIVLASASSLFDSFFSLVTEKHNTHQTARRNLDLFVGLNERCMKARDSGHDERVLDVRYEDLIADPIATVRRIYEHGAIPWPATGESVLREHLRASRRARKPHHYNLRAYGIQEEEVRERFAPYVERFLSAPDP